MDMMHMSVAELAKITASDAPAPGGGSISAMAGAYGAALAEMVAGLTLGRKKYEGVQADMERVAREAGEIRRDLLECMQRDASSFDAVMAAMALPKSTDVEKAIRREAMQFALKAAAESPMFVAERAAQALNLAEIAVCSGNPNAVTDGLCGAMLARTAALGALYNVRVNLLSIQDEAYRAQMLERCRELKQTVLRREAEIIALAPELA